MSTDGLDANDILGEKMLIRKAKEIYGDKYPEHEEQVMEMIQARRNLQRAIKNLNAHDDTNNNYEQLIAKFDLYPEAVEKLVSDIFERMETKQEAQDELKRIMVTLLHFIGLSGEVGELGEKIKKSVRDGSKLELRDTAIAKEMGDCAWYLFRLASDFDYPINEILTMNYEKLSKRLEKNKLHGEGDDREQ